MPRQHPPEPPIPPVPPEPPIPPIGFCKGFQFDWGDSFFGASGPFGRHGPFGRNGPFGPNGPFGGGGSYGRGRKRMFEGGELRLVLLKLIADEPRHGYDLIRAIEEMTGGEYAPSPGVVYPTLTLLQDMGLIEEAPGEGPRKPFQVTDEGRAYLEERSDEADGLFERLEGLKPRHSEAGPAIGRAVKNLMTALSHRIGRDGLNDDLLHEIAAILDEAAQRIERIKSGD
jgi:DNA-binding PadR family transcriptional regulator